MPSDISDSRPPVHSVDALVSGSPGSAAPDLPFPEQSAFPARPNQAAGSAASDATAGAEQDGDSSTFAAPSSAQERPNTPVWPGGEERHRVSILEAAATNGKDGRDATSRGRPRSSSPSLLSTLREFAATLAPNAEGGETRHARFTPDAVDPAVSHSDSPRQVPLVPCAVSSNLHDERFSSAAQPPAPPPTTARTDNYQDAARRGNRDRPPVNPPSGAGAAPSTQRPFPAASLALPDSLADLRQRNTTREPSQRTPELSATVGTSSTFLPSFVASSSLPFGCSVHPEIPPGVRNGDTATSAAAVAQTLQVSPQSLAAAPPQGTRDRWPMWQMHSLLKKGRSHFMTRRNLWDYCEECLSSLWELLQLSPGERGGEEFIGREKTEPIHYPLRLDKPAGEAAEQEEEEELEDADSGRMTTWPRRFANDKRERAYIRASHSLFAKRFSGPYRLSVALITAVATAAAVGILFLRLTTFGASFSDSLESPARAFALAVLAWSACGLLVAATLILPYICCLHAFPSMFRSLAALVSSFSPPPGPLAPPLSPPFFSFESPFSLSPPPSPQCSPTGSQDAEDALFASAFLRIYHRCVQGDIAGAEALADEAVAVAQALRGRQEKATFAAQNRGDAGGNFQKEAESGRLSTHGATNAPRALSRAMQENKKLEALQENRRRASETRKAIMCSITNVTLHPSAVSVPSREEEDEKRKLRPLLEYEAAVKEHTCRGAWLLGAVALSCFLARLLLLVPVYESQLEGVSRGAREASSSLLAFAASDAVRVIPAPAPTSFSFPLRLSAYAHWLSLRVVPLVACLQFAAAVLLLRPREDLGILQKLGTIATGLCVACGVAQVALFDASEKEDLPAGLWLTGKAEAFLAAALCVALRILLLCALLVAARVMELRERQLFLARSCRAASAHLPASCASSASSACPSPGALCSTTRAAAAAATLLALAAMRRS
ncbi:conserved hypothetical protein [Neospora caninum Liverpool]|uniref:Transmembrane protein n=1 Tax=Neospora caninum (strain Liverpool) TaxID=572307 RepID=F0VQT0_NEOCL|nr:conserved hypothetical protein [Neospora caninum Liverpool]CBZ56077.1 conserved hypothetical protein [Neospora caninum Liverpool]CEL70826.1 TPA: hypothetical protein BN1204_065030 [Neospora caninum Liverpool]|eukprot:XP_003886103.1 conserved hypothetical protein [Neospora caninum Liverpool]